MTTSTSPSLPSPSENQAYCEVSALEGGFVEGPLSMFIDKAKEGERTVLPSLSFILHHSRTRAHLVFDLGVRRDTNNYPPRMQYYLQTVFAGTYIPQDVPESLEKGGLSPSDITQICVSHIHWDHVGNPLLFPNATFFMGAAGRAKFQPGYPADPDSVYNTDAFPWDRTTLLTPDDTWAPIGPFPRAFDFYGDGSLYIVDAPGHCAGHVNVLARTSADGAWVYLAGDSAHDWRLLTGEAVVAAEHDQWGKVVQCAHDDKEAAETHIANITALNQLPRVRVLLAHDTVWYKPNKGGPAFWPGKIESL